MLIATFFFLCFIDSIFILTKQIDYSFINVIAFFFFLSSHILLFLILL